MFFFQFLSAGAVVLAVPVAIGVAIWLAVRPTPQRDAAAAQSWANFHHYCISSGWQLLYVHTLDADWPRGSKAHVSIYADSTSAVRDSWFWWHHVQPGSVVAVSGLGEGWGPHTRKDDVLFIGDEDAHLSGVRATFGAQELVRARRHWNQHPRLGAA